MSTPIVVTVVLLIIIGMTIFFYLRRSIDDKQNISGVGVDTVSTKKIYQDRGYAPAFQGKIQKFVDDKRVIDNKITKISDQAKRLRLVEVELKNKLIKQKTEAELKRSLDSQFRLDNELSIEKLEQLDNSERDMKLQIDETTKLLEQITSTVKTVDSKLIEVKLAKKKEYDDKSQIISDEIDEKKEQAYLKIQKAKMLVEQAKKDKEDRAAAFRARMDKYKEDKVVVAPTDEEKYARALEIALKNKAIRLKAEAEMKQLLDAQRKLKEDLSEKERIALDAADADRQAVIDENDRLMEEANTEIKNAEALRVAAQAKFDEEFNAAVTEAEELRKDEVKRLADIDAKAAEKMKEFQDEFDQAEQDQNTWDQLIVDQVEDNADLESSIVSDNADVQAKYDADLARGNFGSYNDDGVWVSNADTAIAEAQWLIEQAGVLIQANSDMEAGVGAEGMSDAAIAENMNLKVAALTLQARQDLSLGQAELRVFKLGYVATKKRREYDKEENVTFTKRELPTLSYINSVNGLDTGSVTESEIIGPKVRGRWTISGKMTPSMEEKLQKDMHALSDPKLVKHGGLWRTEAEAAAGQGGYVSKVEASIEYLRTTQPPEFKALMVKYKALQVERMNQGDGLDDGPDREPEGSYRDQNGNIKVFDHVTRAWRLYEPPPLETSHGFDDFGLIRTERSSQPLVDECISRCDKFLNCGGFQLDTDMNFCRLVNKDVLDLKPRSMGEDGNILEPIVNKTSVQNGLYHTYYKVPRTEFQQQVIVGRSARRQRIIQMLPEYAQIPDPDLITGDDKAVQDYLLRREDQFTKLLSDPELVKQCRRVSSYSSTKSMCKTIGCPPKDAVTAISPLKPDDCTSFLKNPKTRGLLPFARTADDSSIKYTGVQDISVPASASKWMIDIDVNTGLHTTDSNMSRVNGIEGKRTKDLCMNACNKFSACKSFVIGLSDVPGEGRVCHLKSEQAGGMTVPSTTHNMWFKERGGFQRVSTPEERKIAAAISAKDISVDLPDNKALGVAVMRYTENQRDMEEEIRLIQSERAAKVRKDAMDASRAVTERRLAVIREAAAAEKSAEDELRATETQKRKDAEELALKKQNAWVDEGGVTPVPMCSPRKTGEKRGDFSGYLGSVQCQRKRGVMTCAEFLACYKSNNQTPCEDGFSWEKPGDDDTTPKLSGRMADSRWISCKFEIDADKVATVKVEEAKKIAQQKVKEIEDMRLRSERNKEAADKLEKLRVDEAVKAKAAVEAAAAAFRETPEYKERMLKRAGVPQQGPVVPTARELKDAIDSDRDAQQKIHDDKMRRYQEQRQREQRGGWGG